MFIWPMKVVVLVQWLVRTMSGLQYVLAVSSGGSKIEYTMFRGQLTTGVISL